MSQIWDGQQHQSTIETEQYKEIIGRVCQGFSIFKNSWVAEWNGNVHHQKTKSFSIKPYGDQAKQMAINHRSEMEAIYGDL